MPSIQRRKTRRKPNYGLILLAVVFFIGILVSIRMATGRFQWWKDAAFVGDVVSKEARTRDTDELVEPADALRNAREHRFYVHVDEGEESVAREVTPSVFRKTQPGDRIIKHAGTWQWRRIPAAVRRRSAEGDASDEEPAGETPAESAPGEPGTDGQGRSP